MTSLPDRRSVHPTAKFRSSRFCPPLAVDASLTVGLHLMRGNDCGKEAGEAFVDFVASRRVVHFDALAFALDQPRFSQHLEMLRQRRLRYRSVDDANESRTGLRALRPCDLRKDAHAYGVGQRVKDVLDRDAFNGRVK